MIFGLFGKKRASGAGTPPEEPALVPPAAETPAALSELSPALIAQEERPLSEPSPPPSGAPDMPKTSETASDVFALAPGGALSDAGVTAEDSKGFLAWLTARSSKLADEFTSWFTKRRPDDDALTGLEELLIAADLGPAAAKHVCAELRRKRFGKDEGPDTLRAALAAELETLLKPLEKPFVARTEHKPYVALFCGVNGSGKTTTIGKIAAYAARSGKKVTVAACDTFRAGAEEQLEIWAGRAGAEIVRGAPGADPASVAFRALEAARASGADLLLIDTAGRLQNKHNLMEELKKILRVIRKADPGAPHESVLVLDACAGQNTLKQIELFSEAAELTGLIMTKLDGTAKGGALAAAALKFNLPVYAVGAGEGAGDLRAFSAGAFAAALAGTGFNARKLT